jgi:hypothetical protein
MSNDYAYQSFKIREAELLRAAELHRLVRSAEASSSDRQKGGADRSRLRGVRLFRRATGVRSEAHPSAC